MKFFKELFTSKDKKSNTKTSILTENEMILHYLRQFLSKINITTEIVDNELILPTYKMSIKGWINSKTEHPNAVVLELIFTINQENFEGEIFEALAGLGENVEASIKNGTHSFIEGVLTAIMESFDIKHNPQLDFETEWNGNIHIWHPKVGPIQVQGNFDSTSTDENKIFNILKDDIKVKIGNMQFYWIKVYVSQQANGHIITECTFNNKPFYEANKKMEDYAEGWISDNQFKGEKQYIIIRQCDKTWSPSKYSKQNINKIIDETIDIMEECSMSFEYDNLYDNIKKLTKDIELAFELYCFIPDIYCQFIFPQKCSEKVTLVMSNKTEKTMYLSQFKIYEQIKKRIVERLHAEYNKEKFQKVLSFSSNFNAINKALNQGCELENLITSPMILIAPDNYNPFR